MNQEQHISIIWEVIFPNLVATNEYCILLKMTDEKINILTSIFLWYDNEQI